MTYSMQVSGPNRLQLLIERFHEYSAFPDLCLGYARNPFAFAIARDMLKHWNTLCTRCRHPRSPSLKSSELAAALPRMRLTMSRNLLVWHQFLWLFAGVQREASDTSSFLCTLEWPQRSAAGM